MAERHPTAPTGIVTTADGLDRTRLALEALIAAGGSYTTITGVPTDTFLGRDTAGTGAAEAMSVATAKTLLNLTGTNSGDQFTSVTISRLLGRGSAAGAGTAEEITLGTNLSMSGTTLNATGGGGVTDGDKGDITVSAAGATWTIDAGVVTLAKQADMATASVVYRKTAGAGAPEVQTLATLKTDLGLTGTNSGDQTITLTGEVTGTGTSSFATTIAANAVTNAKAAQVATATIKGRVTAATGNVEDLTGTQATTLLDVAGALKGLMSAADKTKLDGVATGATANSSDATLLARANHTGTQAHTTVTMATARLLGRSTAAAGAVEEIVLGTNLSFSGTTLNASGGGTIPTGTGFTHITAGAQDAAAKLVDTADVNDAQITLAKMANMATSSLIYRKTAAAGVPEVNTLATLKTDLGLTGTNNGDQTSIVGITGTLAQFDTAITDANITPASRLITTTAPLTIGGGANADLSADRTLAINAATTAAAGSMSAADKIKVDAWLTPVHMAADAAARGAAIADYFATTISLEAASTYDIECHVHFTKTTAGTVVFTWQMSSASTMLTSRYEGVPITGYTTAVITGAPVVAQATARTLATIAHIATGSLTTAVDHSYIFWVRVRTNLASTIQLRTTESAGTITPRAGSYMQAFKIL